MEEKKTRKQWTSEEKVNIIRQHFNRSKMVETCEEFRVHPNVLSKWWKIVLEAGKDALTGLKKERKTEKQIIENYEKELSKKNEIIAELSQELLELKKKQSGRN